MDKKNVTLTENTLEPYIGKARCWLNPSLTHLPTMDDKIESNFQFYYFLVKKSTEHSLWNGRHEISWYTFIGTNISWATYF